MADRFTEEDDALLEELGVEVEQATVAGHSAREERIIAGFEEIQRFVDTTGHAPAHGEDRDIFERLYAVRLDRLRALEECRALLAPMDRQGLLGGEHVVSAADTDEMSDDELLAELGVEDAPGGLTELRHVRSTAEKRAADEIASRERCEDFNRFAPLFELAGQELKGGTRQTRRFGRDAAVARGDFFVLGGQLLHVAEVGEVFRTPDGAPNARLRVIYANGTQSNLLLRSLQAALYKDETGRRVTEPDAGPLFSDVLEPDDIESGTIYVLRSLSDHPYVAAHRELIHKIGVTGGEVGARIANATHDATYLLAGVEVVATYTLAGINRAKLERVFHRIFAPAQLDLTIHDRFGNPVHPREWFLVPLHVIDAAVAAIRDGSITGLAYDPNSARLVDHHL